MSASATLQPERHAKAQCASAQDPRDVSMPLSAPATVGSGKAVGGSLLENREGTPGRVLGPGDEVVLQIERLVGARTPIRARPG